MSTIDPDPLLNVEVEPELTITSESELNSANKASPLILVVLSPHAADLALKSPVRRIGTVGPVDLIRSSSRCNRFSNSAKVTFGEA